MFAHRCTWILVVSVGGAITAAVADDESLKSSSEQRLAFARRAAEAYHFRISEAGKADVILHPEPLLRWNNKVVREDDGMLFLWTEGKNGRPVASAQFFMVGPQWNHEFQSMSTEGFSAQAEGDDGEHWTWGPTRPGVRFVRADRIGAPAESANVRLRQMKSIAERFTAAVDPNSAFENPEQLRLLATPIYRYSAPAHGILDGAMFAIVQGTNPEVLVLVEADASAPAAKVWRYAFARMSCFFLRVHEGNQLVWSADREPVPTPDRSSPYFFRAAAQRDRSADLEVAPQREKGE